MGKTDYNTLLYEKMKAEQDKYRDWLLTQEPAEILNHTYEYPCPLDDVYEEFKDREVEHMDTIRDSIETRADQVIKRENERESR